MAKKLKGLIPDCEVKDTNAIIYSGDIPSCIVSDDCNVDVRQLTFLLDLLLKRYCEDNNVIDADLSSIDLACLIADNPDIDVPADITLGTLMTFYKDHICALYTKISDLAEVVENQLGLICLNDAVQVNKNEVAVIDAMFNDITSYVSGTLVLTISTAPLNGTAVVNPDKTITYTPNTDFVGNDTIYYTITKGGKTCTAKIAITVVTVLSEADISDIVLEQLTVLLTSNEYWDLGIPKGTKMGISAENLVDFNFSGMTPGKGLVGTKWKKWAICNGFNLAEDFTQSTFRGFDHTSILYDSSGLAGGSDTVSLIRDNIPAHTHKYFDAFLNAIDGTDVFSTEVDSHASSEGVLQGSIYTSPQSITEGSSSDRDAVWYDRNTGDGTNNISNVMEIANGTGTVTAVNIRNAYKTLILVQKVEV